MTLNQIREKARGLGVKNYSRLRKAELIRAIQAKEGNSPCYEAIAGCQQQDCLWQADCQS
jgi:Rho termination factor, N-terminal domain